MEYEYSKITRDRLFLLRLAVETINKATNIDQEEIKKIMVNMFKNENFDISTEKKKNTDDIKQNYIITQFMKLTLLTDTYLLLKEKASLLHIDQVEKKILKKTKKAIDTDIFKDTLENSELIEMYIINSINMNNIPYYRKVLMMYLLDDDDVFDLCAFNPIFEYEYNYYHKPLTSEQLISELTNVIKYKGYDKSLSEFAFFLIQLYNFDEDSVVFIILDIYETLNIDLSMIIELLEDQDMKQISIILDNYYQKNTISKQR